MTNPIWHPYTQHALSLPEISITRAKGSTLYAADGRTFIDAISSWWVNPFGHGHEKLAHAIHQQILELDQIIFAGFTHPPALKLAEKLLPLLPMGMSKIFFSDNGSTAVEVALKMAIQKVYNTEKKKCRIIALEGAYHGDTFGVMAAGEKGKFFEPFEPYVFEVHFIPSPTKENGRASIEALRTLLNTDEPACFLFEPMVQGAGGMIMHQAETLSELIKMCKEKGVCCIADEVMTGFGRTGKAFACEYLTETPDIICLSKCLTGGILPMALTICTEEIYLAFHSQDISKTLFHGHSYTGNPVGCAAALASIELFLTDEIQKAINTISKAHILFVEKFKGHKLLRRIESLGTILALEIRTPEGNNYFSEIKGRLYQYFLEKGLLMRPLGNVIYVLPPYCLSDQELQLIYKSIEDLLNQESFFSSKEQDKCGLILE